MTPIHVFTFRKGKEVRRRIVPGGICDGSKAKRRAVEQMPGWTLDSQTWRSDYRFIDHASNSQPDYEVSQYQPPISRPPWSNEPFTAEILDLAGYRGRKAA